MRYFDLQIQDHIKQVGRLMNGLEKYPDILASNLPPEAATKTRVTPSKSTYKASLICLQCANRSFSDKQSVNSALFQQTGVRDIAIKLKPDILGGVQTCF
jgi:hypothetical protein